MRHLMRRAVLVALALGGAAAATLEADEGFWPFNSVPRDAIKGSYGFEVTDAWLDHLRLASVKFGGASGSFVSPDGLVLTNHHVGLSTLQKLSTPDRDLVKNGFYARSHAEEIKAPDMELNVLVSIEDVTDRINADVKSGIPASEAYTARQAAIAAIEQESTDRTGLKSDVVTLYQGALYHLYRYKRYTDVRLVFAPEFDIAFFGGDPDNFTYPRYCLDMTLFRVYERDQPARTDHYLRWSTEGLSEGELVFTAGHPGATQRLNTMAHLAYLRDTGLPLTLRLLERRRDVLQRYAARGAEQARQVKDEFFGVENSLKSLRGQLQGLRDPALMAKKQAAEDALRRAVKADAALNEQYGGAWDAVASARGRLPAYAVEDVLVNVGSAFNTKLFWIARTIVRVVEENARPEAQRLPEYTAARRPSLERQLYSPAPIYRTAEEAKLADSLTLLVASLGADHPVVRKTLAGKPAAARAAELVSGTTLVDPAARKALVAGGPAAVAASTDPMIVLARTIDPDSRAMRKRYEDDVVSVERDAYARIAGAVFATRGTGAYPDATSTLRLSFGAVKGYLEDGRAVPPFTEVGGLFARERAHRARPPYDAPERWNERRDRLDLGTKFNLVSTNDIVGGNSGSPLVNRHGEIVGLVFDGNIQSLPGYFVYDADVNRAVSVDARAILHALRVVYDAGPLADELVGMGVAAPTAASR